MTTRVDSLGAAETGALVRAVSQWVDDSPENRVRDAEALLWGRVAKVSEEAGEAVAALVGATGQNPRKGVSATTSDVERELLDVAMTALCAVAHLHADDDVPVDVMWLLQTHVAAVAERAGLT
ncbi:MazG-like family protein [Streptomyces cinnamoneus]|uniref:MazG-like family protein n=1 Tax=Streptomyces cinnamoneus TaxID=53446 RepID=UPI00341F68E2